MADRIFEPNDLAGSWKGTGFRPQQLWAGESEKVTESRVKAAGLSFAKYEVYAVDQDGSAIKFDPSAAEGAPAAKAHGFTAQPVGPESTYVQGYVTGSPNHEALVWPESLDTFEKRRAAFYGSRGMFVEKLNGAAPE